MFQKMSHLVSVVFVLALLVGCGPVTPYATPVLQEIQTSTSTPLPSATPTIAFYGFPRSYVPSATPTFALMGKVVPDLEIISPENIGRLELINRWGKGRLLDSKTSPDHIIVAVATTTGIYLYRAQDLMQVGYLNVAPSDYQFMEIGFSPDSKLLAVAGHGISLWDIPSQTMVGIIPIDHPLNQPWHIKFTPDGRHIAVEENTNICGGGNFALYTIEGYKIFDVKECGFSEVGMDGYFRIVNDRWFYYFNNSRYSDQNTFPDEVIKVDLIADKIVDVIRNDVLRRFYDISPDGKLAAYLIGTKIEKNNSYTITYRTEIVDVETGQIVGTRITWQSPTYDEEVQTEPDNSTTVVRKDKLIFLTDRGLVRYYFDASGERLVVPSYGTASVLDVKTGEFIYSISSAGFGKRFNLMGLNLDGSRMVLGTQEISPGPFFLDHSRFVRYRLEAVDTATGEVVWSHIPEGTQLVRIWPSMDASFMLIEDNLGLHVWDINSGREERSIPGATGVYQSVDGQQYIFVKNNQIHVWDVKNWKDLLTFDGGNLHYVRKISPISKLGRIAIFYTLGENPGKDQHIAVFDVHSGKKVFEISDEGGGLELMEDQSYFVHKRNDGYIELWSTDQNTPVNTFLGNHVINNETWNIDNVLLSPDLQIFITYDNKGVEFWSAQNGDLLAKILRCTNPLFSPDGRILVTVSDDGTFWVWGVKAR